MCNIPNMIVRFHKFLLPICCIALVCSCKMLSSNGTTTNAKKSTLKTSKLEANYPYRPAKTRVYDLLHTKLEIAVDWEKQQLNGKATLLLKPYFYNQSTLALDAKGMDIHSLEILGKKKYTPKYAYDKKVIEITLEETYSRFDSFYVEIGYTAKPNELPKGGSAAITEDKGLYFINPDGSDLSKPRQVWTQGETEASSAWFPTIDATNERCTQEMYITADTNFQILTNGEYIYSKANAGGSRTEYWKMDLPHAPYLFMMAVGEYAVVEDKMKESKLFDWKDFEIKYYVEPEFKPYAKNIFGNTPEMIEFFSTRLGVKYAWQKYSQIVVRDYVSGAMENTTASVFMEALQVDDRALMDDNWDFIIAHELFHHWFGDLATCESWANLPLNESFANYSEFLWAEYKFGIDEAYLHAEKEAQEYFDESKNKNVDLIRFHYKEREDMFDRHSYNKGGLVLNMLRHQVGDEAFFKSLNVYLTKNRFKATEIHDLRLAFEEVTGEDLNWFFNQWFLSSGHPTLNVKHTFSGNTLKLNVIQLQDSISFPIYRLPLEISVWENGIVKKHKIDITQAQQEFSFSCATKPQLVLFDSQNQLLGIVDHAKTNDELIFQYDNANYYPNKIEALRALFEQPITTVKGQIVSVFSDPKINKVLDKALSDSFWAVRKYALDQFTVQVVPNVESYLKKLSDMAINDSKPKVKANAMMLLASIGGNSFDEIFKANLNALPYSVCGAAMDILLKKNSPEAAAKAKELEFSDNLNIAMTLGMHYVKQQDSTKYYWYKKQLNTGNGQKQYNMLFVFEKYIAYLPAEHKADAKKVLENIAAKSPHEVIKKQAKVCLSKL